ncbi:DUF1028 domain-containing protein [Plastorhodobacter daqingensis]|uniref:DUF1028 domain-containing protein n=1 Tax=Plastorhodobacter daqingensis TaxID=1387281 RepID=A0ABW2UP91_9RHOB
MTWSIAARDETTGALGVAVASRFFAVGGLVPFVRPGVGAVATQAFISPLYGPEALRLLPDLGAEATIAAVTNPDEGRANRQLHLVDAQGRTGAFTGSACIDWAGHVAGKGVSVAGNMLAGPEVIAATLDCYETLTELPFAERLLAAMEAGEAAGGDKRGRQSAALVIHRDQDYPWLSIRADDHADPLAELRRLYAVAQERFLHVAEVLPTRQNPHGATDRSHIDRRIAELDAARKAEGRSSASFATPPDLRICP